MRQLLATLTTPGMATCQEHPLPQEDAEETEALMMIRLKKDQSMDKREIS
jgi:hypothetical protein